jgi:hypothetical protein
MVHVRWRKGCTSKERKVIVGAVQSELGAASLFNFSWAGVASVRQPLGEAQPPSQAPMSLHRVFRLKCELFSIILKTQMLQYVELDRGSMVA